ncbi:MAG: WecB/TagA/CpsF family glycosyltransferase [Cyanobacteria bacterium CRU_2_1]|nr:WecB/TagA/CpsF family glycosyltransferase [Cyanobacteria bacterium RU_5_0]NJR63219.1 WecB/TagA/CpsF family glycosyltransferase [Cyanobacteria bacterium CRU_2_1]
MYLEMSPPIQSVIGFPVTALPFQLQIELMLKWASLRMSKAVCVANVHMLMEAHTDPVFASVITGADLVTPDGMPLVWLMNVMGVRSQDRVAGMDILLSLCKEASVRNISVFFLGSKPEVLGQMRNKLNRDFSNLHIVGMEPLPFRPLTPEEDRDIVEKINQSGAGIVLVSLGCPKQEIWINQHKDRIYAVMVGLGGAFPVYAGIHKRAPTWVRQLGMEWCYRLFQEPRRLWKRYYETIPPFMYLALKQMMINWLTRGEMPDDRESKKVNNGVQA